MSGSNAYRPRAEVVDFRGRSMTRRGPSRPNAIMADDERTAPRSMTVRLPDGGIEIHISGDIGENPLPARGPDADFDRNLAEDMDSSSLAILAAHLLEGVEADISSRKEWEETADKAADYLGIVLKDPKTSISTDGVITQTVSTCLLEACAKMWGVARGELLPVGGPVKVTREAPPPTGIQEDQGSQGPGAGIAGADPAFAQEVSSGQTTGGAEAITDEQGDLLAAALEADMNYYLTMVDREYYPDFSKMLFSRALIGNAFRKVYRCPIRRRPISTWVKAQDLIVSNDCSHLSQAGRITERIRVRQATMRRYQATGHYRDIALVHPTGQTTDTERAIAAAEGIMASPQLPQDWEHLVYECYCEIGSFTTASLIGELAELERDETGKMVGYPLPYRVSIDYDSREILEIRRNWRKGDTDHVARRRYVRYGFMPGLGFYDYGLIHLCGNPTQAATMIQRAITDASLYANFPGGIYMAGPGRQSETVIRPLPGQFMSVPGAGAARIQDVLMPLPYKPPGPEESALMQKLEGDVRRIAGIIELPVGEGRIGNTPVGTILSYIEAVTQVPGAVHKDDHITQSEEFELLRELFAEEPEVLWRGRRKPARKWQVAHEIMDPDLVPASDPNVPSQVHRLMKAQAIVAMGGMPQFAGILDNRKIADYGLRILGVDDPAKLQVPPAPPQQGPPDPRIAAAQIKSQTDIQKETLRQQGEQKKHDLAMQQLQAEQEGKAADRQSEDFRAAAKVRAEMIRAEHDAHAATQDRAHDTINQTADRIQADRHHANEMDQGQQKLHADLFTAAQKPTPGSGE